MSTRTYTWRVAGLVENARTNPFVPLLLLNFYCSLHLLSVEQCTPDFQWAGHAGLLWELHEQELSRLNDDRREKNRQHARALAVLTRQLGEERELGGAAAAQERDAAAAQLRAAQEVRASERP